VSPNARTVDFEYAGTPLSISTTYYVRVAAYDTGETGLGLWSHMDMGNEYKFTTDATYMEISNSCSDTIQVEQSGNPLKYKLGEMYGTDFCTFTVTSTATGWDLYYGMASTATGLKDVTTGTLIWAPIDNGTDCTMVSAGTWEEEEYGFNIGNVVGFGTAIIQTDTATGLTHCNQSFGNLSYVFDIELLTNKDKIIDGDDTTPTGATFDLNIHANVDRYTAPETYELETIMILSDTP
jgi:hypothetical protein